MDVCDGRGLLEVIGSRGSNGTVEGSKSRTGFESVGESMVAEDDKCRGRVMKGPCQFNKNLVKVVNTMRTKGDERLADDVGVFVEWWAIEGDNYLADSRFRSLLGNNVQFLYATRNHLLKRGLCPVCALHTLSSSFSRSIGILYCRVLINPSVVTVGVRMIVYDS